MRYAIALLYCLTAALAWPQGGAPEVPSGASQLLVRGETYYYWDGSFYRPENGGYRRVEPPLGARVPSVPGGASNITISGDRYSITSDGTFFLYDPRGGDYTVVTPPPGWRDYTAPTELYALPAPKRSAPQPPAPQAPAPEPQEVPPAYPSYPNYGADRDNLYPNYGRYRYRDGGPFGSYRDLKSACRRIASDQSRRAMVGPYRRQPGGYWDEYERCLRLSQ
ncbi:MULTISPECIES: DUF6515 family protein [unclassified Microbulbifer]|uniref:DUF6515 family protein n=1 Tax=unclassified Microbulbifer TaxID=2619833 RepID=UPI0027E521B9|nr:MULTISPECIES: DUF6515 family protein [unclassified Microbulbifer]